MRVWNWNYGTEWYESKQFWSYLWGFETTTNGVRQLHNTRFWSYLWGFETRQPAGKKLVYNLFWSYLWGFETRPIFLQINMAFAVLELPMRVWNLVRWMEKPLMYVVLELPMRVWNFSSFFAGVVTAARFWSYLWGFETRYTEARPRPPRCFGVTYEGLKLDTTCCTPSRQLRFGVTYEGLKRECRGAAREDWCLFWSYLWGFETGTSSNPSALTSQVLELPMRVWNMSA